MHLIICPKLLYKIILRHNCLCLIRSGLHSLMYRGEETGGLWTGGYTSIRVAPRTPYTFQRFYFPVFMYDKGQGHAVHRSPHTYSVIKHTHTSPGLPINPPPLSWIYSFFISLMKSDMNLVHVHSVGHSKLPCLQGTIVLRRWPRGMWLFFDVEHPKKPGMLGKHIKSPSPWPSTIQSRPNRWVR